jgi:hypothetical protein
MSEPYAHRSGVAHDSRLPVYTQCRIVTTCPPTWPFSK